MSYLKAIRKRGRQMKFLTFAKDGGSKSHVSGFWFLELKSLFSVVVLRFEVGSREAYHSHAFNAFTWFLSGEVVEHHVDGRSVVWRPSWRPKHTPKSCFHKVYANKTTYALSFRGPWSKTWLEYLPGSKEILTLSNGRKILKVQTEKEIQGMKYSK